jgi:CHAT domain-containing protein/tetratricopeptide (TPR) repeat protein
VDLGPRFRSRPSLAATGLLLLLTSLAPHGALAAARTDTLLVRLLEQTDALRDAQRWSACDSVAALALARAEGLQPPDSSAMAFALFQRGNARFGLALFDDSLAMHSLGRSLSIERRLARPDTIRWIGTADALAKFLLERGELDSALTVLSDERALCRHGFTQSDSALASVWMTTGRAYRNAERNALAIAAFDSALAIRTRLFGPDDPDVAEALTDIGIVYSRAGQLELAEAKLARALAILERSPGYEPRYAAALSAMAGVQYHMGDIARSIETLERAAALYARVYGPNSARLITPLFNIGLRLFDFGDYRGANAIFTPLVQRAEVSFGPGQFRTETIREMAGASALKMGDTLAAEHHITVARTALLARPLDQNHISNVIECDYATLLIHRGDVAGAGRVLAEGLAREHATPEPLPDALTKLLVARAEFQMANFDTLGLDSTLRELEDRFGDRSRIEGEYHAQYLRIATRAEIWRGRRELAWRDALASEEADRAQLVHNIQALPDTRALELEGQLGASLDPVVSLSRDRGDSAVATAWDRVARWRGLVGAELAQRRRPRAAADDTALAAAHARWVQAVRRYARLEVAGAPSDSTLVLARAEVERTERSFDAVALAHGVTRESTAVSLARIRAALRPDQALVSIVVTAAHTDSARLVAFATLGSRGPLRRIELGRANELAHLVNRWRSQLEQPPVSGRERQQEAACRLAGLLVRRRTWDRLAPLIAGARELAIVADGELANLPWQALPDGTERYLVEIGPEIQTPGAERELLITAPTSGHGLLALGAPDYNFTEPTHDATAAPTGEPLASAPGIAHPAERAELAASVGLRGLALGCVNAAPESLPALPGALAEVSDIARDWNGTHPENPARLLVGAAGTEGAFRMEAPGREVLHIATHGIEWGDECRPIHGELRGVGGLGSLGGAVVTGDSRRVGAAASTAPARSPSPWEGRRVWLALAGANQSRAAAVDANDGLLTADEIVTLDLSTVDWVVLSACQSGVGLDWPLEGSVGMRRAFRLAGARTVIASQWSISDQSTREWMRALYAARAAGEHSAGGALAAACREVLSARRRAHLDTHPFRWAAFTATGL